MTYLKSKFFYSLYKKNSYYTKKPVEKINVRNFLDKYDNLKKNNKINLKGKYPQ